MWKLKSVVMVLGLSLVIALIATPASAVRAAAGTDSENPQAFTRVMLKYATFTPDNGEPVVPAGLRAAPGNTIHLIQVAGPLSSDQIEAIETAGATLLGYVPEFNYLAKVPASALASVKGLSQVRWVGEYHPAYKIEQGLLARSEGRIEINVLIFPGLTNRSSRGSVHALVQKLGGMITYEDRYSSVIRALVPPAGVIELAGIPEVLWIDAFFPPMKHMDNVLPLCGADTLHGVSYDGAGVVGEVKDSGIDQDHPEFGNLIGVEGSPPEDSHGTSTFGMIFADGSGDTQATGLMPGGSGVFCDWSWGRVWSIASLKSTYGGVFQSNSWSSGSRDGVYSSDSQDDDQAVNTYDVTMLYSAGNSQDGVGSVTISRDSAAKNVICVGGLFHKNTLNRADDEWHSYFGAGNTPSQGPAADGRIKPDLCGVFDNVYTADAGGGYTSVFGGTSAACPMVGGCVGLLHDMYLDNHFGNNPSGDTPQPATVKAMLIATAYKYQGVATRYQQGWGWPDVSELYDAGANQMIIDGGYPLATGETKTFTVERAGAGIPMKITLVWDDKPASPPVTQALVNDLNLLVTAPSGTEYKGNVGLLTNPWSYTGGSHDTINNVENVFIQNPESGAYSILITGFNVALDNDPADGVNQDFSLAASRAIEIPTVDTLGVSLDCTPGSGTVPFTSQFTAQLINLVSENRRAAARINVIIANGNSYSNWKSGWTNLSPLETFTSPWSQSIPSLGSVIGDNVFTLLGQDVTPAPYNQPPYANSGDTDNDRCTVTGIAP